jgi:hypothetical protein
MAQNRTSAPLVSIPTMIYRRNCESDWPWLLALRSYLILCPWGRPHKLHSRLLLVGHSGNRLPAAVAPRAHASRINMDETRSRVITYATAAKCQGSIA